MRIALGRGVCGTAAAERRTLIVPDVHEFPGHIACDAASRSEIVVPLLAADTLLGVLDLDSPQQARFDAADAAGLERLAAAVPRRDRRCAAGRRVTPAQRAGRGLLAGAAGFTICDVPLYLHALRLVPALQVVAHRIGWSCLFSWRGCWRGGELRRLIVIFTQPALLARLLLTALLISTNWLVYVWGVGHGHIVDASLGYYINPLINVVLGIFVLRER